MTIVVTGAAGFIGSHVAAALMARGESVLGIDNMNDYYTVALKEARLARLTANPAFRFVKANIADRAAMEALRPGLADATGIIHLAAQAGVRYSLENPYAYVEANVMGHLCLLEMARNLPNIQNFVYASSSSVYGGNKVLPFSAEERVDSPVSIYAATKKADELMSHAYSHLYGFPTTGLRFFTVYGPWGRPDMAAFLFADAILAGKPIKVFNSGEMQRDFTYIDDIVTGAIAALDRPAAPDANGVRCRVYNLGNHRSEKLLHFIDVLEQALGRTAIKQLEPMQPGDVPATYADIESSRRELGFEPTTPIAVGIPRFVQWYKEYHKIS